MIYAGANDGMLHAFNADIGAHRWACMPSPSFAKPGKRAIPLAGHTRYVEGPIITHDFHDGTNWRTILVADTLDLPTFGDLPPAETLPPPSAPGPTARSTRL
jgi:type IV pilus assembly protein PilY1